jgi:hypothetical protein
LCHIREIKNRGGLNKWSLSCGPHVNTQYRSCDGTNGACGHACRRPDAAVFQSFFFRLNVYIPNKLINWHAQFVRLLLVPCCVCLPKLILLWMHDMIDRCRVLKPDLANFVVSLYYYRIYAKKNQLKFGGFGNDQIFKKIDTVLIKFGTVHVKFRKKSKSDKSDFRIFKYGCQLANKILRWLSCGAHTHRDETMSCCLSWAGGYGTTTREPPAENRHQHRGSYIYIYDDLDLPPRPDLINYHARGSYDSTSCSFSS